MVEKWYWVVKKAACVFQDKFPAWLKPVWKGSVDMQMYKL